MKHEIDWTITSDQPITDADIAASHRVAVSIGAIGRPYAEVAREHSQRIVFGAMEMAARLHAGQVDKVGQPYLLHPLRVMMRLPADASTDEKVAALLHDTIEDCGETAESLSADGVAPGAVAMIQSLTRRDGETYQGFLERLRAERIAVRVKLADIEDNTEPTRMAALADVDPEAARRLMAKYHGAREFLMASPDAA